MKLAMVGLGRMGGNMVRRLLRDEHEVVAWDRSADAIAELAGEGAEGAKDLADLVKRLETPRVVWLMVPAGAPVDQTIELLLPGLEHFPNYAAGSSGPATADEFIARDGARWRQP